MVQVLSSEDALQVYEAWGVSGGVEVAAPGALAPSFWIAVASITAAGGAFAFEDEIDAATVGGLRQGGRDGRGRQLGP